MIGMVLYKLDELFFASMVKLPLVSALDSFGERVAYEGRFLRAYAFPWKRLWIQHVRPRESRPLTRVLWM